MTRWRGTRSRGFTLAELMVVVVIVGVMATLGLVVLGRHQKAARTYETLAMVQSIRVAQERWRSENLTYLNVSSNEIDRFDTGVWFPRNPVGPQGGKRVSFLQSANAHGIQGVKWIMLNPTSNPLVYGGYRTNAGMADQAMKAPEYTPRGGFTWPTASEPWYTIEAVMDSDADGTVATYLASSLNGEIYRQDEGE
ncbi:MAG TPA: prepilin-type N-terminal cleavage/methylation domain-containing protein [Polyangiaceae bacterium]|nr:prepilin-type N-terminal cleavage/methylation domain-containing protein [Polyangiaceae bacterium]